jgi:hypothetical protein
MEQMDKYTKASWDVNMLLCGIDPQLDPEYQRWSKSDIRKLVNFLKKNSKPLEKETILYRGSKHPSPTMQEMRPEITSCQILSTSYSEEIGYEFSKRGRGTGYLHVLRCQPGLKVYEVPSVDLLTRREREVIIPPGCKLLLKSLEPIEISEGKIKQWRMEWIVLE